MSNVFEIFDIRKYPLQTLNVNGAQIGYRIAGSGQPILLVTGYGATMDMLSLIHISEPTRPY